MSVTISNCHSICASPTNQSPSKMLYSFSRTGRFATRTATDCDRFYDIPSTVEACRTTSLGFGHKYDFTQNAPKNPSPNTYQLKSDFSPNKTTGFGFGKGRQEMEVTGPLAGVRVNKNPGPGSYAIPSALSKSAYSLGSKVCEVDKEKMKVPGPGSYPVSFTINENGKYFLSKFKNSKVRDFSKIGGRITDRENKVPGPGRYETNAVDLSPSGKYTPSRMKNCLTRKFAITTRKPIADKNTNPGPGSYQAPSQFGHYIAKNAFRQHRNSPEKTDGVAKTEESQTNRS